MPILLAIKRLELEIRKRNNMILAIIGSRTFQDEELLRQSLASFDDITEIVSGGAKGADAWAEIYAKENQIPLTVFKPNWKKYGQGAGVVRNTDIINYADEVVAFWDGESKGTKDSIDKAHSLNKKVHIIYYEVKYESQNIIIRLHSYNIQKPINQG